LTGTRLLPDPMHPLEVTAGVSVSQILAEKYRVERVIGAGGMGVVVAARHLELDEQVAIKFLLPEVLADAATVARFFREAKAVARIKSEHVARVFDVGRLPNGAPYMVMEYLEGSDLSAWLAAEGALPVQQAVDFILQACVAIAEAHALGIVHRDLKPANLFCVRRSDGQFAIKVLDFGISKMSDAERGGMSFTQTTAMMGSPLYMSPEQFRSTKTVDLRTDIWALGTILYELLTGRAPFSASTVTELAIRIATEPARSPLEFRSDLPPALASAIVTCLEKEPERRFPNVSALAVALEPFASPGARATIERIAGILGQTPMAAREAKVAPSSPDAPGNRTTTGVQWTRHQQQGGKRGARWLVLVGIALGAGALAAGWWRASRPPAVGPEQGVASGSVVAPVTAATPPLSTPIANERSEPASAAPSATAAPAATQAVVTVPAEAQATKAVAPRKKVVTGAKPARAAAGEATGTPRPGAVRVSCDPPFFFDSAGNRVFKQECL
jgi:eukaryotic-like serine/threonine-protein kinase